MKPNLCAPTLSLTCPRARRCAILLLALSLSGAAVQAAADGGLPRSFNKNYAATSQYGELSLLFQGSRGKVTGVCSSTAGIAMIRGTIAKDRTFTFEEYFREIALKRVDVQPWATYAIWTGRVEGDWQVRAMRRIASTGQTFEFTLYERADGRQSVVREIVAPQNVSALNGAARPAYAPQGFMPSATEGMIRAHDNVRRLFDEGRYLEAKNGAETVLKQMITLLGPDHVDTGTAYCSLARCQIALGELAKAEVNFRIGLRIFERALGANHEYVANALIGVAALTLERADAASAEAPARRAVAIYEATHGIDNVEVAVPLMLLARVHIGLKRYAEASAVLARVRNLRQRTHPPDHELIIDVTALSAHLASLQEEYERAAMLYEQILHTRERTLRPDHPAIGEVCLNLSIQWLRKRRFREAETFVRRALEILKVAYGASSTSYMKGLQLASIVSQAQGDITGALARHSEAIAIAERTLDENLSFGSERQRFLYLDLYTELTDRAIALHVFSAPNDEKACRRAVTAILMRKGRSLDVAAHNIGIFRDRLADSDRALVDLLQEKKELLSRTVLQSAFAGTTHQQSAGIRALEADIEQLEAQLSTRGRDYGAMRRTVTIADIESALPSDAALIEYALVSPLDLGTLKSGAPHYVAYVIRGRRPVAWADLGDASSIDPLVASFRTALRDPRSTDVAVRAKALDARILEPLRTAVGNSPHLIVSPEGSLNLVPFAALVDEGDRYEVVRHEFTYLSSGRDLLRERAGSAMGVLVVANPDFDSTARLSGSDRGLAVPLTNVSPKRRVRFGPLPGTDAEAKFLRALFPDATVLTGADATEGALKRARAPQILHVATHGFFLDSQAAQASNSRILVLGDGDASTVVPAADEFDAQTALARSGLALAGANIAKSDEDGLLTALEVGALNLSGTELVVLSACDTGVGAVRNGDGVFGLRRALLISGSACQVMSLWPVSDGATSELMRAFYERLLSGSGRSTALHQVQRAMLADHRFRHPFYWASFIQSGAWGPLRNGTGRAATGKQ